MLRFRNIDVEAEGDVQALVDWANDRSIRHLFLRSKDQASYERPLSFAMARDKLRVSLAEGRHLHLIELGEEIVGEVSLDMASEALHQPAPNTAWFGLVLGKEHARGRGHGRQAMLHLEKLAVELGASHAQVGVFEYNERARRLYASLGYAEIARTPDFTWWQGKTWTDIRMSKTL